MIVKPLIDHVLKDSVFLATDGSQTFFKDFKVALTNNLIINLQNDKEGKFILDVDACTYDIVAVLSQVQNGREKIVSFASRTIYQSCKKLLCHK